MGIRHQVIICNFTTYLSQTIIGLPDVADKADPEGMVAEKSIADLRTLKKANKPFFLACGFVKPHLPFYAPKKYWDLYDDNKIKLEY